VSRLKSPSGEETFSGKTVPKKKNEVIKPAFDILKAYDVLFERWGEQHWWPADSQLEIVAGALLAQATSWNNAKTAVAGLKSLGLLADTAPSLDSLIDLPAEVLEQAVRSSGYFRQKADRLRRLLIFLRDNLGPPPWDPHPSRAMFLRSALLGVKGLGPETVDSILLYGFGFPVFVVDAYTRRVMARHGMIGEKTSYDEIRLMFENALPKRSGIYNEYHALIVRLGKEHCRRDPCCDGCPLDRKG
jgi:endonuclease-3 related protein